MPSIIPICRFCLMEMIKPITHEFMKTCSCPSQYSYVHEQCFKNWLLSTEIPPTTCSLCGTDYPKRFYPHTPFKRPIVNILLKVLWCILLHVTLQCAQCFKSRLYEREEMLRIDDSLTNVPEWLVVPVRVYFNFSAVLK
ncbi:hypothetical protein BDB01DRAFT_316160 [Pilobolus umbonatus]|nr:hypothetical protein BDB01DRAFT_316160 [Pilobolus umbonatus]